VRSALVLFAALFALSCAHRTGPEGSSAAGAARPAKGCADCHGATLATQRGLKSVHAVVRDEGSCARCHLPHDTERTAPLADAEPKLCNACHGDRAYMRPHGGAGGIAACTPCHAPHASAQPTLLRGAPATLCGSCHPDVAKAHSGYPVAASRCTGCHRMHGGGAKLQNPLVHEVASDCSNCHAAADAPQPLATSQPQPGLCFDCHPELQEQLGKVTAPHAPARDGTCTACHSPHSSAVDGLLAGTTLEVCGACHPAVIAATRRPQPHKPAADGRCGDCHQAHGGQRAKLLVRPPDELCASCHPVVERWVAKKHLHAPLQMGDCSACHDPHGGAKRLLKADAVALCLGCHAAGKEGFIAGSHVHAPEPRGDCLSCHDPHASDAPRLVTRSDETLCKGCHDASVAARRDRGEKLHTPFLGGNCAACHAPHAAGKAGLRPGDVCVGCHVGTRRTWTKGVSVHSPFAEGACQDCHDPHGSKERAMLKQAPGALCTGCHFDVQGALEQPGAVVHDPLKTGTCLDCHHGHGSTQPALLVDAPEKLCGECHDVTGKEAIAKHGGYAFSASDCTGCHVPHAGEKKKLLRAEEHMPFGSGDCKSCHVDPVDPPGPPGVRPGGLGLCADCHDFGAMTKVPNAHAPVAAGRCFDCHSPHVGIGKAILRAPGAALCRRCHDARETAALPAHVQAGPAAGECGKCHPHHSPKARSVKRR
jgi:predicted CXXCH cytochrome family protein